MKQLAKIIATCLTLLVGVEETYAQFFQQSSLYMDNWYLVNPAGIGHYDYLRSSFDHRNQWSGIKGAPRSNSYSISTPVKNNIYLGGVFLNDKEDLIERTSGVFTYAYRLKLDKKQVVFLALSGGMSQIKLNFQNARVENYTDQVLNFQQNNATAFSSNFGAFYQFQNFSLGVSVPNFARVNAGGVSFGETGMEGLKESPLIHGSMKFEGFAENWSLTPGGIYRFAPSSRSQYEGFLQLSYKNSLWLGYMHRQYAGAITMLGANITDQLQVSYSYEFPTSGIALQTQGTHEFMVSLNLRSVSSGFKKSDYKKAKRFLRDSNSKDSSLVGPNLPWWLKNKNETISVADALKKYHDLRKKREALGTFKNVNSSGVLGDEAKKGYYVVLAAHRTKKMALVKGKEFTEGGVQTQIILNDRKSWYLVTGEYTLNKQQAIIRALHYRKNGYKGAWVFINK